MSLAPLHPDLSPSLPSNPRDHPQRLVRPLQHRTLLDVHLHIPRQLRPPSRNPQHVLDRARYPLFPHRLQQRHPIHVHNLVQVRCRDVPRKPATPQKGRVEAHPLLIAKPNHLDRLWQPRNLPIILEHDIRVEQTRSVQTVPHWVASSRHQLQYIRIRHYPRPHPLPQDTRLHRGQRHENPQRTIVRPSIQHRIVVTAKQQRLRRHIHSCNPTPHIGQTVHPGRQPGLMHPPGERTCRKRE